MDLIGLTVLNLAKHPCADKYGQIPLLFYFAGYYTAIRLLLQHHPFRVQLCGGTTPGFVGR